MSSEVSDGQFLGISKTKFNSSVCLLEGDRTEIFLTERLNRQKNSGLWPSRALMDILPRLHFDTLSITENSDVEHPAVLEEIKNQHFPFYDYLKQNHLERFCSRFNPDVEFVTHHLCHAYAALAMSPFNESLIVVMDGAGNRSSNQVAHEECSVYLQDGMNLELVYSRGVEFTKINGHTYGNRTGALYEKASEYIFKSPCASGKVMGLAALGSAANKAIINGQHEFDWNKAFRGGNKKAWEQSPYMQEYIQLASDVQAHLEEDYYLLLQELKTRFPHIENLILTGGCALNCTNNAKIYYQKLFLKIYVPPFPGDESISFGAAFFKKMSRLPSSWQPLSFDKQAGYFGPISSVPEKKVIERVFADKGYKLQYCPDIEEVASDLLVRGKIIAWFQGRSESGPRALGNRSILSRPDIHGLKNDLNERIKFREHFRPYGCSVLFEHAHEYFEVEEGFNNPFMSYAIRVRPAFAERLKEVSHVDGTSRMQTVRPGQNLKFYRLLQRFGEKTGLHCLLNTSLNVMDEPIVETINDAERFFDQSAVDVLILDQFLITKSSLSL